MKRIIKLIWANRKLYRKILAEIRDISVILIFITLLIWFILNGISETQENYRLNHLESRMNSHDTNIKDMTVIE